VLEKFHGESMSRSLKKGPYIDPNILKKIIKQKETGKNEVIKTWSRDCQVAPEFVGHKIAVHNSKKFIELLISENMVGHHLGEFAPTRTFKGHGKVTKKVTEKT
jgi:small subunit ribosomal protein S19